MGELAGRIYVAGHTGLVGSACVRVWAHRPGVELLTATRAEVDLTDARAVAAWLDRQRPDVVVLAAGRVGGIRVNDAQPAAFVYDNLMIEANLIHAAWQAGARRLINFGSACMYPKSCEQPMRPSQLLTGPMEPTSEPYAVAKLAGLTMTAAYNRQYGTAFTTVIPCTLYGPGDHFDPLDGHVIAALIRKFHDAVEQGAETVTLWGSGAPKREFLYVDDLVDALLFLLPKEFESPLNIGTGEGVAIRDLAAGIAATVGFKGRIEFARTKPDGAPRKVLDVTRLSAMGWKARTTLQEGLRKTYDWLLHG